MVSEAPSLPHADAVTSKALHIIFKLKDEMSETSPPAYKIIKSWIFSGRVLVIVRSHSIWNLLVLAVA